MAFRPGKLIDSNDGKGQKQLHLSPEQAWEKVKPFCAYQERCHSEVKEKLYGYGLHRPDVEQLISRLIEENYLNEERFAISYASGHSRIKKWGKIKITHALRQKGVSAYCIKKALNEIDTNEYVATLHKLAGQKWDILKKERPVARQHKCRQYLLQKGYESSIVNEALKIISNL